MAHARAWATSKPVIYGNPPPIPDDYTTFDLEYLRQGEIWLAGVRPSDGDLTQIWAWTAAEETNLMGTVADYWAARPDALMATWWGKGADLPALRRAAERTGIAVDLDTIRHFDLCHWAMGHLRLPIHGLSLKEVASYLGLSDTTHGISGGDEAVEIYLRAREYRSMAHRNRARATLEAYNPDDLASLSELLETLRGLYPQDEYIASARDRRFAKPFRRGPMITPILADEDDLDPQAWMVSTALENWTVSAVKSEHSTIEE